MKIRGRQNKYGKFLIMAVLMMVMLTFSGCRTRITNNNEVSNIHYDESGFLRETYEMRRDELGLMTAEKPLMPDLGTPDYDDTDDDITDSQINYTPDEEEPYEEPQETKKEEPKPSEPSGGRTYDDNTRTGEIKITFDPTRDGAVFGEDRGRQVQGTADKGDVIALPDAADFKSYKKGYILGKWVNETDNKEYDPGAEIEVRESTLFKAKLELAPKEMVTVTFNLMGGKSSIESDEVEKGKDYKIPQEVPTRKDHTFSGWNYNNKTYEAGGLIPKVEENITLIAEWNKTTKCTITFNSNGGSEVESAAVDKGAKYTIPETKPTKDGSEFEYWEYNNEKYEPGQEITVETDMAFVAKWKTGETPEPTPEPEPDPNPEPEPEIEKCTISFDSAGGTEISSDEAEKGSTYTIPSDKTPLRDGYKFLGWVYEGDTYTAGRSLEVGEADRITLVASWDKEAPEHKIAIRTNDGATEDSEITVTEGGTYDLKAPTWDDYHEFLGWFDENDREVKSGDEVGTEVPASLTAKWNYKAYEFWENEFNEANKVPDEYKAYCFIEKDKATDKRKDFIKSCTFEEVTEDKLAENDGLVVIRFVDKLGEKTDDEKNAIIEEIEKTPDVADPVITDPEDPNPVKLKYEKLKRIVLLDSDLIGGNNNRQLLNKMMVLESIYGSGIWETRDGTTYDIARAKGEDELNIDDTAPYVKIYPEPYEEPKTDAE